MDVKENWEGVGYQLSVVSYRYLWYNLTGGEKGGTSD